MNSGQHRRIVVGFDGSEQALGALRWSAAEAAVRGNSVHAIAALGEPAALAFGYGAGALASVDEEVVEWTRARLMDALKDAFPDDSSVGYDSLVSREPPTAALLEAGGHSDLIVVGQSGASTLDHLFLGSVTRRLMASSPCPLVVTSTRDAGTAGQIVVGVDGSANSHRAVDWALEEADRRNCGLLLCHTWSEHGHTSSDGDDLHRVDAALVLDQAAEAAREINPDVESRLIEGGTVQALLDLSEESDLLVLGTHGRGGFRSMLFGSVAHAVATHSACPTVFIR